MRPAIRAVAIIALVVFSVFVALYLTEGIGKTDPIPDRAFDAGEWRHGDRRMRGATVDDLGTTRRLIGKDTTAVIALLGMPDASDTAGNSFDYAVDPGLRTGPWGLGGTWLFYTSVRFDTATALVTEVHTRDRSARCPDGSGYGASTGWSLALFSLTPDA